MERILQLYDLFILMYKITNVLRELEVLLQKIFLKIVWLLVLQQKLLNIFKIYLSNFKNFLKTFIFKFYKVLVKILLLFYFYFDYIFIF